jgi:Ca2+-binding RTX toxin-like protein
MPVLAPVTSTAFCGAAAGVAVDLSKQVERIDITGGAYDDTLTGGSASDILTGGAGADHFVFNNLAANGGDKLADFTATVDQLDFSKAIFAGLGDVGPLVAVKFWSSASDITAHSADDRLIYNTTTGTLYYDADGTEAATAIKIATFGGLPALTSDDIFVY